MARYLARVAASLAVLAFAGCGPADSSNDARQTDAASGGRLVSVEATSARLAYIVSQYSPLLSEPQRVAISQDFNGIPLAGPSTIHTVVAQEVSCGLRTSAVGDGVVCSLRFTETQAVEIGETTAADLYDALGAVGVESQGGSPNSERSITALSCTVDDHTAQSTPSTGENVAGFACQFTTEN